MVRPFNTNILLDVERLKEYLNRKPKLFDHYNMRRTAPGSPHSEMTDIWLRYKDVRPHLESGDFSTFGDEHDSIWYPEFDKIPDVRRMCARLMYATKGTRLGGVLITKLPPGGKIKFHSDHSWHADYYEKFYVPIQNEEGATFSFRGLTDGNPLMAITPNEGEVWWFDNSEEHAVVNGSNVDRLAMIVCIRRT